MRQVDVKFPDQFCDLFRASHGLLGPRAGDHEVSTLTSELEDVRSKQVPWGYPLTSSLDGEIVGKSWKKP